MKYGENKKPKAQTNPTYFFVFFILELGIMGHNVFLVLLLLSTLLHFFGVPKKKIKNHKRH